MGGRRLWLTSSPPVLSRFYKKCVGLEILKPYGLSWNITGIELMLFFTQQERTMYMYEDLQLQLYTRFNSVPYKKFWVSSTSHSDLWVDRDTGFLLTGAGPVHENTYPYGYGIHICFSKKKIPEPIP
jgi:hypothetical protein